MLTIVERIIMSYRLNDDGSFEITDFNQEKVFANFFPGVAGLYGIPMWAFYINRGQGISSFGVESKDKSILEFQPANRAYRLTSIQGFRTFLKVGTSTTRKFYEPFANPISSPYKIKQRMVIQSHDMTIEEINETLGLKTTINYFTLPQAPYAALVRRVTFDNISKKDLKIECLDGLPAINPYGLKDWLGKHISRTAEAWVAVRNLNKKAPFFQLKVEVADTPQVTHIHEGNFYFAFDDTTKKILNPIVESAIIFGQASDFLVPENFLKTKNFVVPVIQQTSNRTPCAFVSQSFDLKKSKKHTIVALAGFAHDTEELNKAVTQVTRKDFITKKALANEAIIQNIKQYSFTHSSSNNFDQYCGQNFLDNVLRGGLPISLQTAQGPVSFNVYSRKHGDLERDYNFFTLAPTYLSQGNGNFRDVNQNRRNDIWFNQDVKDSLVINFYNLIQADGYNPLVIKGLSFSVTNEKDIDEIMNDFTPKGNVDKLRNLLRKGFMPGELLKLIDRDIPIHGNSSEFLSRVLSVSQKQEQADFGEGYWSDHWTYNLDLIESYLRVYPENLKDILLDRKAFYFYLNDAYVLPREKRHVLTPLGVRQYHSLAEHDKTIQAATKGHRLRTKAGQGEIYHTNLLVKLLAMLANKTASLDPSGIGVEMEANKPNWYDSLNGLPGLLGSSISETLEIKRLAVYVKDRLNELRLDTAMNIMMFQELTDFVQGLTHILKNEHDCLEFWKKTNNLKEHYRHSVRSGIDGAERGMALSEIMLFLSGVIDKTTQSLEKARDSKGLFATYFYHEVTEYQELERSHFGEHHVRAIAFKRHDLPYFLEGFVHALRVMNHKDALNLYQAIKKSPLYDKALGMYRVNASLKNETEEIGRTRIFPSGWLENESVWLHMEYKYLLELLRNELHEELFNDLPKCLVPFLDPKHYGRSVLENSSFIVSSAHEDQNLHGQGFVARLSGSTAEFVHIWLMMSAGLKPFVLNQEGLLEMQLKPILPAWLFTQKPQGLFEKNTYAFKFLNQTLVVYHNPKRLNTYGKSGVSVQEMRLVYTDKRIVNIKGSVLSTAQAVDVRSLKVARIDAILG